MFWQGWWEEENTWERVARWFWVHCEQVQNSWRVFCSSWKQVWSWVHCQSLRWREARQVYQVIWMFNWDKLQPQVGKKEAFCEELEAQVAEMFAKRARTNAGRRYKDGRQRSREWTCERCGKAAGEKSRLSNFNEYYSPTLQSWTLWRAVLQLVCRLGVWPFSWSWINNNSLEFSRSGGVGPAAIDRTFWRRIDPFEG